MEFFFIIIKLCIKCRSRPSVARERYALYAQHTYESPISLKPIDRLYDHLWITYKAYKIL